MRLAFCVLCFAYEEVLLSGKIGRLGGGLGMFQGNLLEIVATVIELWSFPTVHGSEVIQLRGILLVWDHGPQ